MIKITGTTIEFTRGDSLPIAYEWPDWATGYSVYLTIKKAFEDTDAQAIFSGAGTKTGTTFDWLVLPSVSELMTAPQYYYDIQISNGTTSVMTPLVGTMIPTKGVRDAR